MTTEGKSEGLLASLSEELATAVERAGQSIVAVNARRRLPATGIVWPAAGGAVVVTADHVVERDEDITVTLADGAEVKVTLAGRDPGSDLAVLRHASDSPTPATLAPAGSVKVGHLVLALGRPGSGAPLASF
ncbi:MAG: trypsin-like peptidase domain-containing protein, partial [Chloroflexi bacterium]|nr:trypsin-like peptidase domain-containing protein [Chloroflexota bacterium]